MKYFFSFTLMLILTLDLHAQVNQLLVANDTTKITPQTITLQIKNLSFIKDNEYFNLIADGYTLFGNSLHPNIIYKPHKNYQLKAGLFLLKYYGQDDFNEIIPTLSLEIFHGKSSFYFGQLYTTDNHQLSDEIYDFERLLDQRSIENGMQHRYKNEHWQTDTWLEWEHFIEKNDTTRERLNFGQTTTYQNSFKSWKVTIPIQIYLQHRGGQINQREIFNEDINSAFVIANAVVGFSLQKEFSKNLYLGAKYQYFLYTVNSDNPEELIFTSGNANKVSLFARYKSLETSLLYWKSDRFVAPKGNDMFQSVSQMVDKYYDDQGNQIIIFNGYTEPDRELLRWTTTYKKEIFKDLQLAFAVDFYYQLKESSIYNVYYAERVVNQFDYSLGLYLFYRFNFRLVKLKQ